MDLLTKVLFVYFLLANYYGWASAYHYECAGLRSLEKTEDPRRLAPWVASIFKKNIDGIWKYHCGGTLIASHLVITAATCLISEKPRSNQLYHLKYSDFRVVVGLNYSDYYARRDEHTQEANVSFVREHDPYWTTKSGCVPNNRGRANIAGIYLSKEIKFSYYVRAACFAADYTSAFLELTLLQQGQSVVVAGFNVNRSSKNSTNYLEVFRLQIQSYVSCIRDYLQDAQDEDIVCARAEPGEIFPCFMEGSGVLATSDINKGEISLIGVYTSNTALLTNSYTITYHWPNADANIQCSQDDTAIFTKRRDQVGRRELRNVCGSNLLKCRTAQLDGSSINGICIRSDQLCDGISHCKEGTDESVEVCYNQGNCTNGQFQCAYGACIDEYKVCDGNMDCADNSDESDDERCRDEDVKRNVTCAPVPQKEGVKTKCYLSELRGGSLIENCNSRSVPVGTTAHQSCMRYYRGKVQEIFKCQRNGTWSVARFLTCMPDCGISETPKIGFLIGGTNVGSRGEWPWHAAIYKVSDTTGVPGIHCGGSLISTRVILTAAHCVTKSGSEALLNETQLRVMFGKLRSDYEEDEHEFSQEIEIERLIKHKSYHANTFESDIALIILKSSVKITSSVRPVCFSADHGLAEMQLNNALLNSGTEFGTTVGFGLDETKTSSVELKILKMPFIPEEMCIAVFPKTNKEIRYTWICGGYTNGSAVCQGDSGGGFVFPRDDFYASNRRYFVQGIVSHGPKPKNKNEDPCNRNVYKVFTKVEPFAKWIQTYVDEAENRLKNEPSDHFNSTNVVSK